MELHSLFYKTIQWVLEVHCVSNTLLFACLFEASTLHTEGIQS
jgi:hypothetical protein